MGGTDDLRTEHRAIERMLAVLERAAGQIEAGQPVRPGLFQEAVDFARNFADGCHHRKEEENLFERLKAVGIPVEDGPIGLMLFEHNEGRRYLGGIADNIAGYEGGDLGATQALARSTRGYVALLREHIGKEDEILFPAAEQILGPQAMEEMAKEFERIEAEVMGPGVHERYHALLDALEKEMGLSK